MSLNLQDSSYNTDVLDQSLTGAALIKTISWLMIAISILSFCLPRNQGVANAEFACNAIAWAIVLTLGVNETGDELELEQKSIFTANILTICSIGLSVTSEVLFMRRLFSAKLLAKYVYGGLLALGFFWTKGAIFSFVFQCDVPNLEDLLHQRCGNREALYTGISASYLALRSLVMMFSIFCFCRVQTHWRRKLWRIGAFLGPVLTMPPLVWQIYQIRRLGTPFAILTDLYYILTTILVTGLSIMASNIPHLRPFLLKARSGMMGLGNMGYRVERPASAYVKSQSMEESSRQQPIQRTRPASKAASQSELLAQEDRDVELGPFDHNRSETMSMSGTSRCSVKFQAE